MADYLRPTEPFVCVDAKGVKRRFDPSMLISSGHWAIKGRERLFEPARDADQVARDLETAIGPREVERATAAPGEKRPTRRIRKASNDDAGEA